MQFQGNLKGISFRDRTNPCQGPGGSKKSSPSHLPRSSHCPVHGGWATVEHCKWFSVSILWPMFIEEEITKRRGWERRQGLPKAFRGFLRLRKQCPIWVHELLRVTALSQLQPLKVTRLRIWALAIFPLLFAPRAATLEQGTTILSGPGRMMSGTIYTHITFFNVHPLGDFNYFLNLTNTDGWKR